MPSIDSVSPRSRVHDPEHDDTGPPPPPRAQPPRSDRSIDSAVTDAARNFNDRVLYVGFNAASVRAESAALGTSVTRIIAHESTEVALGGTVYDLANAAEVRGFAQAMGVEYKISLRQQQLLEGILLGSPKSGRDELARIAMQWAPAEQGAAIPSRLVLSGHSSNGMVWGDGDVGYIHLQAVRDLGKTFPRAAAQVEDIHVSGCFSEREVQQSEKWTDAFPNARTIWGYGAFAPHAPTRDLADWERATRGRAMRFGEGFVAAHGSATAWSVAGGIANATSSLAERRQHAADADTRFAAYLSGETRITNAHEPNADRDYSAFQMLAAHRDATPAERDQAIERGAQLLRLRFWETSLRSEIASHHGAQINDAFVKAGLPPVDFARLTRKEAMDAIDAYEATVGSLGPILRGVRTLDPATLPASWCH